MFERFDATARQAVVHAQDGARDLGQHFIGTEHLLLGLVWDGAEDTAATTLRAHGVRPDAIRAQILRWMGTDRLDETDAEALHTIGIDLDAVRTVVEDAFGPGALDEKPGEGNGPRGLKALLRRRTPPIQGHLPLTGRAKKALELSLREATRLECRHIEAGHILLGLLRARGGPDTRILTDAGIDLDALQRQVVASLSQTT
jgi:ATP-dependent Clp protease ATP-binding subunit ClpA